MKPTLKDNGEVLAPGVVLFSNCFSITPDQVKTITDQAETSKLQHYTPVFADDGSIDHYLNQSDHKLLPEHLDQVPVRVNQKSTFDINQQLNNIAYRKAVEYCLFFPDVITSLWWQNLGHFAVYNKGSLLGEHSDNDVNYQPKTTPVDQSAVHHVLSVVMGITNDYSGGQLVFPHLKLSLQLGEGDVLLFPSNFVATHKVEPVLSGQKISFITWFGAGSENADIKLVIDEDQSKTSCEGKVWIHDLPSDVKCYYLSKQIPLPTILNRLNDHDNT